MHLFGGKKMDDRGRHVCLFAARKGLIYSPSQGPNSCDHTMNVSSSQGPNSYDHTMNVCPSQGPNNCDGLRGLIRY
jgi:hypothetical protein